MTKIIVFYATDGVASNLWSLYDKDELTKAVKEYMAEGRYTAVAAVECSGTNPKTELERAYGMMQNGVVTDSWLLEPPEGLTSLVPPIVDRPESLCISYGWRSACMGDVFILNGKIYTVASSGFALVT